jgi:hypothetical protein
MPVEAVPYGIEYLWKDREGTLATTNLHAQNRPVLASDVIAKATSLVPLLRAVSGCHLIAVRVISRYQDPAIAGAGEAERRGQFEFVTGQGTKYITKIPGFKDGLVDANGRDITVTSGVALPEVEAFVDKIVNGAFGPGNGPCNEAGIDITACRRAKKVHIRSLSRRAGRSG